MVRRPRALSHRYYLLPPSKLLTPNYLLGFLIEGLERGPEVGLRGVIRLPPLRLGLLPFLLNRGFF